MNSIAENHIRKEPDVLENNESDNYTKNEKNLPRSESQAARVLQKTYRGHRERRQLRGLTLDPTSRWAEAVKEAQYLELTTPRSQSSETTPPNDLNRTRFEARQKWSHVSKIARRAGGDEENLSPSSSSSSISNAASDPTPSQREARRQKRLAEKQERVKSAKQMDLSYFLEMVDLKHRYGSNLRKYHAEWKARPTHENFFYWLDHGEGREVEVEKCSRERLEAMQVRYLGREERRFYEVVVDKDGKLVWRKDGVRVDTCDRWRDSIRGIVPIDDVTPVWAHRPAKMRGSSESGSSSEHSPTVSSPPTVTSNNPENKDSTSPTITPAPRHSSFYDLIHGRSSQPKKKEKKKQTQEWLFVSDTNNNLYIGIKQSGAFQHSSFLHGSRISAAGLIIVKDGQLRILQPRSGHYRTPAHNLHIFIKSLQSRGVDMSATAVGSTYAAMVGIETYMKTKGRLKGLKEGFRSLSLGKEGLAHGGGGGGSGM